MFKYNFTKLQEYFFVHKENKKNNFVQQFLIFQSDSANINESTTMHIYWIIWGVVYI